MIVAAMLAKIAEISGNQKYHLFMHISFLSFSWHRSIRRRIIILCEQIFKPLAKIRAESLAFVRCKSPAADLLLISCSADPNHLCHIIIRHVVKSLLPE